MNHAASLKPACAKRGLTGIIILTLGVLAGCDKSALPIIKQPELLRADCLMLALNVEPSDVQVVGDVPIPASKWPSSIKELQPIVVARGQWGVALLMEPKGNNSLDLQGFYIFVDSNMTPPTIGPSVRNHDRYVFGKKIAEGIYEIVRPSVIL